MAAMGAEGGRAMAGTTRPRAVSSRGRSGTGGASGTATRPGHQPRDST